MSKQTSKSSDRRTLAEQLFLIGVYPAVVLLYVIYKWPHSRGPREFHAAQRALTETPQCQGGMVYGIGNTGYNLVPWLANMQTSAGRKL